MSVKLANVNTNSIVKSNGEESTIPSSYFPHCFNTLNTIEEDEEEEEEEEEEEIYKKRKREFVIEVKMREGRCM